MTDHNKIQADQFRLLGKKYAKAMSENQKLNMHLNRGVALVDAMTIENDELKQKNMRFRKALEELRNRAMSISPEREEDGSIIEDDDSRFIYEFCKQALETNQ